MKRYIRPTFLLISLVLACASTAQSQNVIIGSNGFLTRDALKDQAGVGVYARMGVELFNSEIGIKSHYGNLNELESYGVSLYTFIPFYKYKKWEVLAHAEGGFSFIYTDWGGSDRAFLMGLGPSLRYRLRDYFQIELTMEYVIFANITTETPLYTQVIIPTVGWSVRI